MIYVGIDVASTKHDCYLMRSETGEIYSNPFTIKNDVNGYEKLHKAITTFVEQTGDSKVRIGLESTGPYSLNILKYFKNLNYEITLLNPLLTNMDKKATTVRKTKTDTIDSIAICNYLERNRNDFRSYTPLLYHIEGLKSISRLRFRTVKDLASQKQILNRLLVSSFPEIIDEFSTIDTDTLLNILLKYPTTKAIIKANSIEINREIHWLCKITADRIISLAKTSIGTSDEYIGFQIKMTINQIIFLKEQVKLYDKQIKEIMDEINSPILSIPGIGYTTGAIILSEIGDINRFSSPDKLLAYSGLDPIIYQSGNYEKNMTISKRGSSYLRWAIHQASFIIIQHDKTFMDYYRKKQNEGKHHNVIIGHVEKKLTRLIFAILKNNVSYIPQK